MALTGPQITALENKVREIFDSQFNQNGTNLGGSFSGSGFWYEPGGDILKIGTQYDDLSDTTGYVNVQVDYTYVNPGPSTVTITEL